MGELPSDKLNILLVIARPYGEQDIAFKTIARPLLTALSDIKKKVNIKVLRPPSFEQFERELNANKGFYHIVHFDGHGNFDPNSTGFQHTLGAAGQGVLVFEANDGSPQIITAAQIAQNLESCRVPIFILNACKSAQEGEEKFSSVATRLVSLGAKGVVAMAYTVYAQAAKHFMGRLYGELVRGESLEYAVALGRKELVNKQLRPSPKGDKPLQDWLVPVLYQQESYKPFTPTEDDLEDYFEEVVTNLVEFPQEGRYGFIGRDYDILRLERAFRQNNIVLLQGMGGVGKTELACGFGRWLDETQGRSTIFFTSFEHGATLSRVVNQVGRKIWGDKFSQYQEEKQVQGVLNYLKKNPCLLIWDNFEPVAGFPTGNEPLLSADERENLQRFLKELRGGKSWVLITSRREESWLDCAYNLVNLRGLQKQDVEELAAKILETAGVDRKNLPAEYLDLLKLLGGHPLSLRVVLPHLKTQSAVQLIEALRKGLDTFSGAEEEGRDKSLTLSLDYSFSKLSEQARRHLPFLGFFCERVGVHWLNHLSSNPDDEYGQAYQAVFEENLQEADWLRLLNEAVAAGILEHLGNTIYKIHPALPWYLRQQLNSINSQEVISELEKKLLVFYAMLADNSRNKLISNAELASFVLQVEEPNLLQNLRLAEQQEEWAEAQTILQALGDVYERWNRQAEFKSLRKRVLNQIGNHLADAKVKGKSGFNFWVYLRGIDGNEALQKADLKTAEKIYQEILDELTALNDSSVNDKIATVYHQLGNVACLQRQFAEARAYYLKALKITEDGKDLYNAPREYHQLGNVAYLQRQFAEARAYYLKALKIYEDVRDFYNVAGQYHQLGMVAQEQQQFEEARAYYLRALKIREDARDLYNAPIEYHQLGNVAYLQRQFEEARAYYLKALKILEDAEDLYNAATVYHQLGIVAEEQRQFEEARAYYLKAVEIKENAGDLYNAATVYNQLGMVAEEQRQFEEAHTYYFRAFEIFGQFGDWYTASRTLKNWGRLL